MEFVFQGLSMHNCTGKQCDGAAVVSCVILNTNRQQCRVDADRYEDLVADTTGEARRLFSRIGAEMDDDVEFFIKMHTNRSVKYRNFNGKYLSQFDVFL